MNVTRGRQADLDIRNRAREPSPGGRFHRHAEVLARVRPGEVTTLTQLHSSKPAVDSMSPFCTVLNGAPSGRCMSPRAHEPKLMEENERL